MVGAFILRCAVFGVSMNGFDLFGQAESLKDADVQIGWIEFPPLVPVRSRNGMRVVIVMPALAAGQQCHQPMVGAGVASFVIAIAPGMRYLIDRERGVPRKHGAYDHAPDKPTQR